MIVDCDLLGISAMRIVEVLRFGINKKFLVIRNNILLISNSYNLTECLVLEIFT